MVVPGQTVRVGQYIFRFSRVGADLYNFWEFHENELPSFEVFLEATASVGHPDRKVSGGTRLKCAELKKLLPPLNELKSLMPSRLFEYVVPIDNRVEIKGKWYYFPPSKQMLVKKWLSDPHHEGIAGTRLLEVERWGSVLPRECVFHLQRLAKYIA